MKKHLVRYAIGSFVLACFLRCNKVDSLTNPPSSQPSDVAQLIFVNTTDVSGASSLVTYNSKGELKWEYPNLRPISLWNQPTYGDKRLFVASSNQLLAMDAETGAARWQYNNQAYLINPKFVRDTIVTAASVIAPSPTNAVLLLNKTNGSVLWSVPVSNQPLVTPVLDEGTVYNLTTNGTGTEVTLTAYDVETKHWMWKQLIAAGFLMSKPFDMVLRKDTLFVGSLNGLVTALNKYTGNVYWSKSFNTNQAHFYKNEIVYNDKSSGRITKLSLQTGNITIQSQPINNARNISRDAAYIYDDSFYYHTGDSLYCTSLVDGAIKWRKQTASYYTNFTRVGETVYCSRQNNALLNDNRIMIMNAKDFTVKDSIRVLKRTINTFSVLSAKNELY